MLQINKTSLSIRQYAESLYTNLWFKLEFWEIFYLIKLRVYLNLCVLSQNNFGLICLKNFIFLKTNNIHPVAGYVSARKRKRFKRRKLKLRVFWRLRKLTKFKKKTYLYWTYHFYGWQTSCSNYYHNQNPLTNKIPLSARILQNNLLDFFYKHNKDLLDRVSEPGSAITPDDFTVFLRNYHQKPYWKFRLARILHWKAFSSGSIRKQRYINLLKWTLKNQKKFRAFYLFLINFWTQFKESWTRTDRFSTFLIRSSVLVRNKDILTLPNFFSKRFNWKLLKKKSFKKLKKISKWSYLNFKRFQFPWLQRRKNFPKVLQHIQPKTVEFKSSQMYDPLTGNILLLDSITHFTLPFQRSFHINYLLKLHTYRYKAN